MGEYAGVNEWQPKVLPFTSLTDWLHVHFILGKSIFIPLFSNENLEFKTKICSNPCLKRTPAMVIYIKLLTNALGYYIIVGGLYNHWQMSSLVGKLPCILIYLHCLKWFLI